MTSTARTLFVAGVAGMTMVAALLAFMSPADAWCGRFGRCGWGFGYRGPGVYVGVPGPYYARPYVYARPRGYYVCPRGFHWAQDGGDCIENR